MTNSGESGSQSPRVGTSREMTDAITRAIASFAAADLTWNQLGRGIDLAPMSEKNGDRQAMELLV
jgi:hypothetical protein